MKLFLLPILLFKLHVDDIVGCIILPLGPSQDPRQSAFSNYSLIWNFL